MLNRLFLPHFFLSLPATRTSTRAFRRHKTMNHNCLDRPPHDIERVKDSEAVESVPDLQADTTSNPNPALYTFDSPTLWYDLFLQDTTLPSTTGVLARAAQHTPLSTALEASFVLPLTTAVQQHTGSDTSVFEPGAVFSNLLQIRNNPIPTQGCRSSIEVPFTQLSRPPPDPQQVLIMDLHHQVHLLQQQVQLLQQLPLYQHQQRAQHAQHVAHFDQHPMPLSYSPQQFIQPYTTEVSFRQSTMGSSILSHCAMVSL